MAASYGTSRCLAACLAIVLAAGSGCRQVSLRGVPSPAIRLVHDEPTTQGYDRPARPEVADEPVVAAVAHTAAEPTYMGVQLSDPELAPDDSTERVRPAGDDERPSDQPSRADVLRIEPQAGPTSEVEPLPTVSAGLSLARIEELAVANNPAIRQARAAIAKGEGIRAQVSLLPNPTAGYLAEQLGDAGTDMHGAFLAQDFVTGGKLASNDHVLAHAVRAQVHEAEVQQVRVLTDVRRLFYEALAAQRRREFASDFRVVAEEGVQKAEKRKEALEGSQLEVLQVQIQLSQVELTLQQASIAFDAAWQQLTALVGLAELPGTALEGNLLDAAVPHHDWAAILAGILSSSPEVRAAEERLRQARANLERQRRQWIPNLGTEVGMGHDNGTGSDFGRVQLGIPLPLYNANEGNILAAQADCARATANVERLRLAVQARLARYARDYDAAAVAVRRYQQEILPRASEALRLSERAYLAGEFEFLQVLIARRTYYDTNLDFVVVQKELAQAQAAIDGLLLTGGLDEPADFTVDDGLRGQALSGQ